MSGTKSEVNGVENALVDDHEVMHCIILSDRSQVLIVLV